jgi:ATP-dependent DNA helicase RecG
MEAMATSLDHLHAWMQADEDEHLEFKAATGNFDSRELARYCAALANEGGGKIVLGVSNEIPRQVVGSKAFTDTNRTKAGLVRDLRLRVEAEEIRHPQGRVLVFHVPARPTGVPIAYDGAYWMRAGESLVPMTQDMLKRIFDETKPDFSASICPNCTLNDLDVEAVHLFRRIWRQRTQNASLESLSGEQLLADAGLIVDGGVTYASLALLGTSQSLDRHLPDAEVVLEYRSGEAAGPAQQRWEFRKGFLLYVDELWNLINRRNDLQHFQDGLFMWDIPTFNEAVVREAILNAISHRDYSLRGSILIRQFPKRLEIVSPGGFPPGVTASNILQKQVPRNRRLAEALSKCGLVERAGQGADQMFRLCISESKRVPDFGRTDDFQVYLTLHGEVQDPRFLRFLEKIAKETLALFTTEDLIVLDMIHREAPVPDGLKARLHDLTLQGVIESVGGGRGTRYILSRRFYTFLGKGGVYTRRRGLDKETNKALLGKHLQRCRKTGCGLQELMQVLPTLSASQVQNILRELKSEGRAHLTGRTRGARWFPVALDDVSSGNPANSEK